MSNKSNKEEKAFSSIDFVGQCLVDKKRTTGFHKAIERVVKKDDIVLDLGTGSGIMALLAAKLGAKKVYAVELDDFIAEIAKRAVLANNFKKNIFIVINDARTLDFRKKIIFNVVISEILTTGMVDESQIQVINNLHDKKFERHEVTEETEILSLIGNVGVLGDETIIHIHGVFGRRDLSTFGGHIFTVHVSGACEIHLTVLDGEIKRAYDEETGLNLFCAAVSSRGDRGGA